MTDKTLARLTRVLAHHSETLQIIASQLAELSDEYAAIADVLAEQYKQPEIKTPEPVKALAGMLRSREAAAYLGLAKQTLAVYRLKGGGPPYVRLGKGPRSPVGYRKQDLDAWLESHSFRLTSHETVNGGEDGND